MSIPQLDRVRRIAEELASRFTEIEKRVGTSRDGDTQYRQLAAALDDCLTALVKLNIWGPANRMLSSEIWNIAGNWLPRGWLQNHAHAKPRGYAGDHEMLVRIYENWQSDDPLGQLFDRYFQEQAAPQAVRNRMQMITDWIRESSQVLTAMKVAVVGSAFGLEVRDALAALPDSARELVQVTLLDLDPAALDFAREQLQPLLPAEQLVLEPANLFRLPDRGSLASKLRGSDLIFCPGVFDYLDDEAAVAMIGCLYRQLGIGGQLIVFQFAPHNPTRAYMEWLGNWYLTYRDAKAFGRLFESARLQDVSIEFSAEPLGIDLYAKVTRNQELQSS
jgi:extracellular factor (EF) 3-hydroxypalmitic acid methyl ester biosynthesis protein